MIAAAKILLLGKDQLLCRSLTTVFKARGYMVMAGDAQNAPGVRLVRRLMPDLLVVEDELAGLGGFDFAALFEDDPMPFILLTKNLRPAMTNKARSRWWFGVLTLPVADEALLVLADKLLSVGNDFSRLQKDLAKAQAAADERQICNLAKGMLMAAKGLREDEAHRYLTQKSMNTGETMVKVAAGIVENGAAYEE